VPVGNRYGTLRGEIAFIFVMGRIGRRHLLVSLRYGDVVRAFDPNRVANLFAFHGVYPRFYIESFWNLVRILQKSESTRT